jgi:hypothetical protein
VDRLLYKYCDDRGVDVLDRLRLKVTPPDRFNDPFEFTPQMREISSEASLGYVLNQNAMREIYPSSEKAERFSGSFATFKHEVGRRSPELAKALSETFPQIAEDFRRGFVDTISKTFGVICLSTTCDDILMWGHYTNSHTGMFDRVCSRTRFLAALGASTRSSTVRIVPFLIRVSKRDDPKHHCKQRRSFAARVRIGRTKRNGAKYNCWRGVSKNQMAKRSIITFQSHRARSRA